FPGVNLDYVRLIIGALAFSQAVWGEPPQIFAAGQSRSAKTTNAELAAPAVGGAPRLARFTPNPARLLPLSRPPPPPRRAGPRGAQRRRGYRRRVGESRRAANAVGGVCGAAEQPRVRCESARPLRRASADRLRAARRADGHLPPDRV